MRPPNPRYLRDALNLGMWSRLRSWVSIGRRDADAPAAPDGSVLGIRQLLVRQTKPSKELRFPMRNARKRSGSECENPDTFHGDFLRRFTIWSRCGPSATGERCWMQSQLHSLRQDGQSRVKFDTRV